MTRIAGFFQMLGGGTEAMFGYSFAAFTAETGIGVAAGVAVGLHGTDVMCAGYGKMVDGVPYDTLTSQAMQAAGIPQDAANGIDAGLSLGGTMATGLALRASEASIVVAEKTSRSTTLYRAVKPMELQDVVKTGKFRIPVEVKGMSAEGKYFTTSYESAKAYGDSAVEAFNDAPYTIIRTEVPSAVLPSPVSVEHGIQAYVLPEASLDGLVPVILK